MALAVQLRRGPTGVESSCRNRKINRTSRQSACDVNNLGIRRMGNGTLISGFRLVSERVPVVGRAPCFAEADDAAMKGHSEQTQLVDGGFRSRIASNRIASNLCRSSLRELIDLLLKFVVNLQLLGILTAFAVGIWVAPARASASRPSTGRNLFSNSVYESSARSWRRSDFEDIEEDITRSGSRQDAGLSQRTGNHASGVAVAAEEAIGNDEFENLSRKPYEITVPLRIVGLRGSVPPAWLKDFLGSQGKRVKLKAEFQRSLRSIFSELSSALESKQLTSRSAMAADIVTIGDSWLAKAISGGLIKPIENAEQFEWYQRLGSKWQILLRRDQNGNIDSCGKVWGVPYRWGSLVIAYNQKKLQQHGIPEIKDWIDLWRPELAGKISMVASPREIVGAVLKVLGASYNVRDFETDVRGGRQAMEEKFLAFQRQVRIFDDTQYLKTLGAGDVWVAVGWSEDVIAFAKRNSSIAVIAPQSGTSLWADLWAIPATTTISSTKVGGRVRGPSPLVLQWFDFCLQPARGNSFEHGVMAGASPLTLSDQQECSNSNEVRPGSTQAFSKQGYSNNRQMEATPNLETEFLGQFTPDALANCEFLEPLSSKALEDFRWLLSRKALVQQSRVGLFESFRSRFWGF